MAAEPGGPRPPASREDGPSPWALAGLGLQWFVAMLVFVYAGNWVDRTFGSAPLGLLVGLFVGGGGVFYVIVRRLLASGAPRAGTPESPSPPRRSEQKPDGG